MPSREKAIAQEVQGNQNFLHCKDDMNVFNLTIKQLIRTAATVSSSTDQIKSCYYMYYHIMFFCAFPFSLFFVWPAATPL
jgi:hypothetical protein